MRTFHHRPAKPCGSNRHPRIGGELWPGDSSSCSTNFYSVSHILGIPAPPSGPLSSITLPSGDLAPHLPCIAIRYDCSICQYEDIMEIR